MDNTKSLVCKMANEMVKDGYNRSDAFVAAWAMVKNNETYKAAHSPKQEEVTDTAAEVELLKQVRAYKELQKMIEELEAKADEIKGAIIGEMEAQQAEELKVDILKIRYKTVVNNRFDTTEQAR